MIDQTNLVIITHAPCTDGFTSKWVLNKVYPNATYIDGVHGMTPPDLTGKYVIMADFTFPREPMLRALDQCIGMEVYDHHLGSQEVLAGIDAHPNMKKLVFDMTRSGAGIVWDEMFPTKVRPDIINYVEDNDIWKFKYGDATRHFNEGIRSYGNSFTTWEDAFNTPQKYVQEGGAIHRAKMTMVEQAVRFSQERTVLGQTVRVSNVPYFLCSETAHALITPNNVGITWYQESDGKYKLSFRSTDGNSAKVMAQALGGNGHGNAAGATVVTLPW